MDFLSAVHNFILADTGNIFNRNEFESANSSYRRLSFGIKFRYNTWPANCRSELFSYWKYVTQNIIYVTQHFKTFQLQYLKHIENQDIILISYTIVNRCKAQGLYIYMFIHLKVNLGEGWTPAVLNNELELNFIRQSQKLINCGIFCNKDYWIGGTSKANRGWITYINYSEYRTADTGNITL